jgi:hypothetical protein
VCEEKNNDPVLNLLQGVAGRSNDPMFEIRSPASAICRTHGAQ